MPINLSPKRTGTKNKINVTSRELLIIFATFLAIFVAFIFPVSLVGESFFTSLILLLVFPLVIIKFLLKEPWKNYGLQLGDKKRGLILSGIFIVAFIFLNYFVIQIPQLRSQISIYPGIALNFWIFLWFELVISLTLHFIWEFFFRGFIQLGLEKKFGTLSLFAQALIQSLIIFRGSWVAIALIFLSALGAGYITKQSRSILYSFVSMWIISLSLDIMVVTIIRQSLF
jgi:membrane protease YdiL (CAAX protease family)